MMEAAEIREAEDLLRDVFDVPQTHDVVLFQAEAVALLEAAAKALATPESRAAAVLTSMYGEDLALWLESRGALTHRLDLQGLDRPVAISEVNELLDSGVDVLAIVQGEALTGLVNPVDEVADAAASRGAVSIIDSVSSVGAEPFTPRRWGRAISVIGFQKAMRGPAGVSAAVIDRTLWPLIEANPRAPRHSFVSLLDIKHGWIDGGRTELPAAPNAEEVRSLTAALTRAQALGLTAIEAEHQAAAARARAFVREIEGIELTVAAGTPSGIATTFRVLGDDPSRTMLLKALAAGGVTALKTAPESANVRWMHYGTDAEIEQVERAGGLLAEVMGRRSTAHDR